MTTGRAALAILLMLSLLAGQAASQPLTPQAALERLCSAERIQADWFAPTFLAAVPLAAVERIFAELREAFGPCRRAEPFEEDYALVFERGWAQARVRLDALGRFEGLILRRILRRFTTLEEAVQTVRATPGKAGMLVLQDGRDRAAIEPDTPLAVGSAFKLTVLAALKAEIAAGRRSWSETVRLRPEWKSLPSGTLQNSPDGTEITLQRLAELMISISDNTAADALIHTVGRRAVEALAPPRNRPFLTTREAFVLKDPANRDLLERYRSGDEAARSTVLQETARRPLPGVGIFDGGPLALDVEWFYTARELCAALSGVADLALTGINPGTARAADWTRVAFKGGSEPGVLNLSILVGQSQKSYCVVMTWNHEAPLRELTLIALHGGVLELLK